MKIIITPINWKQHILLILLVILCCPFSSLKTYGQEITYPVTPKDVYNIAIIHSFNEGYSMDRTIRSLLRQELEKNGINAYFNNFYLNCEEYENEEEKKTAGGFISVDYNAARNLAVWEEKDRGI